MQTGQGRSPTRRQRAAPLVADLQSTNHPSGDRVVIRSLGPAEGGPVNPHARTKLALLGSSSCSAWGDRGVPAAHVLRAGSGTLPGRVRFARGAIWPSRAARNSRVRGDRGGSVEQASLEVVA